MCICCPIIALRMYMAENDKINCIRNPLSLILSYHNFVNISTVSQVRICRGTRNTRNASAKFWKTSEAEKVQTISFRLREAQLHWAKPTSFATCRNIIWGNASTSFICAASGNDVLASLEMMLPLRANDVVPAAQMKNPRTKFSGFLAGVAGFEPTNAAVKVLCLTAWRHPNIQFRKCHGFTRGIFGVGDGIRTHDLQCHKLTR